MKKWLLSEALILTDFNGVETVDSRQVAEAVDKEHGKLLRDIRVYCGYLNEAKIDLVDFFIESTYDEGIDKLKSLLS